MKRHAIYIWWAMSLIKGKPDPKFVIKKSGQADETFVVTGHTDFEEDYDPNFLRHEMQQEGELRSKLRGFRYHATIAYDKVNGSSLIGLSKILNRTGYDTILFYPNSVDKPLYYVDVTIDDESVKLAYFYLLAQKEFTVKLIGRKLLDSVPLVLADFLAWGNISLQFSDLNAAFSTLP